MTEIRPFFITERLLLRPWEVTDMYDLYEQAKNPKVCVPAGYPVHTSPEHSLKAIDTRLRRSGIYAIVPLSVRRPVGSISINFGGDGNICLEKGEAEIGYWLGEDYWGNGYVPEAARVLIEYAFTELGTERIWCICRTDNSSSIRVQEKCGFEYVRNGTLYDPVYGMLEMCFTCLYKEKWIESHQK